MTVWFDWRAETARMDDSFAPGSLVAEAIMSSEGTKLIIVVEGDFDDAFLSQRLDPARSEIVNARGKSRILSELESLADCDAAVLVLLDRDFDGLSGPVYDADHVVYTDRYNLEAMVLLSPTCFARVWRMHARADVSELSEAVRQACEQAASVLGYLRLASQINGFELNLAAFPVSTTVELDNDSIVVLDLEAAVKVSILRSKAGRLFLNTLRRHSNNRQTAIESSSRRVLMAYWRAKRQHPTADTASGHDVALVLNKVLSSYKRKGLPSAPDLEWHAAVAFDDAEVQQSGMFSALSAKAEQRGYTSILRAA